MGVCQLYSLLYIWNISLKNENCKKKRKEGTDLPKDIDMMLSILKSFGLGFLHLESGIIWIPFCPLYSKNIQCQWFQPKYFSSFFFSLLSIHCTENAVKLQPLSLIVSPLASLLSQPFSGLLQVALLCLALLSCYMRNTITINSKLHRNASIRAFQLLNLLFTSCS